MKTKSTRKHVKSARFDEDVLRRIEDIAIKLERQRVKKARRKNAILTREERQPITVSIILNRAARAYVDSIGAAC